MCVDNVWTTFYRDSLGSVHYILACQLICTHYLTLVSFTTIQSYAFLQEIRTCSTVDITSTLPLPRNKRLAVFLKHLTCYYPNRHIDLL